MNLLRSSVIDLVWLLLNCFENIWKQIILFTFTIVNDKFGKSLTHFAEKNFWIRFTIVEIFYSSTRSSLSRNSFTLDPHSNSFQITLSGENVLNLKHVGKIVINTYITNCNCQDSLIWNSFTMNISKETI